MKNVFHDILNEGLVVRPRQPQHEKKLQNTSIFYWNFFEKQLDNKRVVVLAITELTRCLQKSKGQKISMEIVVILITN